MCVFVCVYMCEVKERRKGGLTASSTHLLLHLGVV